MEVNFIIAQPIGKSKKFKLKLGEYIIIGRSAKAAQVSLIDDLASNCHCKVSLQNNQIQIEDLNSKNGVYLNGVRILKQRMFIKDKVKIGESILYINQDRLDDETFELLTYTGTHIRSHGGFTLELDKDLIQSSVQTKTKTKNTHTTDTGQSPARTRAFVKNRLSKDAMMSRSKLHLFEQIALTIDIIISISVCFVGFGTFYLFNSDIAQNLSEKYKGYQILFSDEMSIYTLVSILVGIVFFTTTRSLKTGSLGERILKIN